MQVIRRWSVRHAGLLNRIYQRLDRTLSVLGSRMPVLTKKPLLKPLEKITKGLLFDCQMCGQCTLSDTGMACPMNCGKQMRNGPCGGVRDNGNCEVKPDMRCVWLEAGSGMKLLSGKNLPATARIIPLDHRRKDSSTWVQAARRELPQIVATETPLSTAPEREMHGFEHACRHGDFVVTVEISPPDSADPGQLIERAERFRGLVHAINITDGAGGNCHMSSVAAASILAGRGLAPVCQVVCRDRNRIALQGDVLGAAAIGVHNVLCLTGDDVSQGDHPMAKPVFDLDSVSLLAMLRDMRDRGQFMSGRQLSHAPNIFLGATANPFVPPFEDRIANLEQKINAGAEYIQTQFCFDLEKIHAFMAQVRARGLHKRARFIIGVGTLSSAKALRWMANNVPGVFIPETVLTRIESAEDQKQEAKKICIETIAELRRIDGVGGVHLMGHRNESTLIDIIHEAGIAAHPQALNQPPIKPQS